MEQKTKDITITILKIVAAVGFIPIAIAAPNAIQALKIFDSRKKSYIKTKIDSLIKKGYFAVSMNDDKKFIYLTDRGRIALIKYQLVQHTRKRWDGKWRVVIFDVFERRRKVRELLRRELEEFGFKHLQDSVWVTPHECEEYIELLKTDLFLRKAVLYLLVEKIDNDHQLKQIFNLK